MDIDWDVNLIEAVVFYTVIEKNGCYCTNFCYMLACLICLKNII